MSQERFALLVSHVRERVFNPDTDTVESPARQSPAKWDHEGESTRVIFQHHTTATGWVTHHCLTRKGTLSPTPQHWATGADTKPCRKKKWTTLVVQPAFVTCPSCLYWLCGRILDAEWLLLKIAAEATKLHALEKQIGPNLILSPDWRAR